MPTRSGKAYLIPWKCRVCRKYYGHKCFGYKCSECSGAGIMKGMRLAEEGRRLALFGWVKAVTLNPDFEAGVKILRLLQAQADIRLLYGCLKLVRDSGRLLRAHEGLWLLGDQGGYVARGHVIASFVADWWNIKTQLGWPSYLVCYYGNFDDERLPRRCPPRPPNALLSCTETAGLLAL